MPRSLSEVSMGKSACRDLCTGVTAWRLRGVKAMRRAVLGIPVTPCVTQLPVIRCSTDTCKLNRSPTPRPHLQVLRPRPAQLHTSRGAAPTLFHTIQLHQQVLAGRHPLPRVHTLHAPTLPGPRAPCGVQLPRTFRGASHRSHTFTPAPGGVAPARRHARSAGGGRLPGSFPGAAPTLQGPGRAAAPGHDEGRAGDRAVQVFTLSPGVDGAVGGKGMEGTSLRQP